MTRLYISIKTNPVPFIRIGPSIILNYVKPGDGYATVRSLAYRKVDHINVAYRNASDEEYTAETSPYRIEFIRYNDWEKLIQDEMKFNPSEEWISILKELKLKYPQFKQQSQLQLL